MKPGKTPGATGGLAAHGIESHAIDVVSESERHGGVLAQLPFWFLGNFQFFTVAIGFIGPSMGLSLGWSALAGTLGILFGTIFMALHATQGPQLGLPQMVQSRAQFGHRGVLVPLVGTLITFVGYNVVQTKLVADGLSLLLGWNRPAVALMLGFVSFLLATWGHDWLHRVFRVLFVIGVPIVGTLTVAASAGLVHVPGSHGTGAPLGWSAVAFAAQFTAAASYNLSFAPQVSDYTRYLHPRTRPAGVIASVFAGAAGSAIWLIVLGAWLATRFSESDALVALRHAGDATFPGLGTVLVVDSVASIAAVMGTGAYSGALTLVTAQDSVVGRTRSAASRISWTAVVAAGSTTIALLIPGSAVAAVNAVLTIMLYLLAPWTAVNLVDFFLVRKGRYVVAELFRQGGLYGEWNAAGLGAYAAGLLASVPFMVVPPLFTGPLVAAVGGVDFAWLIGLVVAAGVYPVLMYRKRVVLS